MPFERLLKGFEEFRLGYYREHPELFEKLATQGQSPEVLVIGCSDARVDPGILTRTRPGDIFTVRNISAMVPPAQIPPDERQHGTSAAIEYAVRGLEVGHIVVLGHALCGGIAALVDGERSSAYASYDYLSTWTAVAQEVRDLAVREFAGKPREQVVRAVEQAAVLNSIVNLMSFPWVAERVAAGKLRLHAWWFNLVEGQLYAFNSKTVRFEPVEGVDVTPTMAKDTSLSAIKPERLIAAAAGKPAF
jgi:carbonic anhydrase